jgi:hypothetical protein
MYEAADSRGFEVIAAEHGELVDHTGVAELLQPEADEQQVGKLTCFRNRQLVSATMPIAGRARVSLDVASIR